MRINKELADGILVIGKDYQYVKAVKKPNANTNIIQEVWFKGKAKNFQSRTSKCNLEVSGDEDGENTKES